MRNSALTALVLAGLAAVLPKTSQAETTQVVEQVLQTDINGLQRTPSFKLRDAYRHPLQTLEFFGIRPDMRVIEVLPGGGWYTEILAPFLRDHGTLCEATPATSSVNPMFRKGAEAYLKKLAASPDVYGKVKTMPFEPPEYLALGAPGSADMVLTFLNMHDLVYTNVHKEVSDDVMDRFFQSAFQVLKPGGVIGIVEHRARAGQSVSNGIALGRVPQNYLIREAQKAGFRLTGTSEVAANPKDDGNYPVWYLPPTLKLGEQDRAKYTAVGESDDMTLRFAKPNG